MAINVNTVYTTVLSILNKEQRGYLTPYEFNQAATQAQLDIFEKTFTELNANISRPKTDFDYSNPVHNIDDEISTFKCIGDCTFNNAVADNFFSLPIKDELTNKTVVYDDQPAFNEFAFYRIGTVNRVLDQTGRSVEIERLQRIPYYNVERSEMTAPSENYPVYLFESLNLYVKPATIQTLVKASFIRKPKDVVWAYSVGSLGQYVYAPTAGGTGITPATGSVDFEISSNQQTEVILEILKYAGVVIRDPQIIQAAAQELAQKDN